MRKGISIGKLSKQASLRIAGLMSGTSADGVDVAIIDFSNTLKVLAFDTYPYPPSVSKAISKLFSNEKTQVSDICHLNFVIGEVFADAVLKLCRKSRISINSIDLISSHGQTIYHNPKGSRFGRILLRSTLQIGEPCVIARRTGKTVVADFRPADIAAGGQGAPLVPYADYLLFSHKKKNRIVQNIGGIANLTWLKASAGIKDVLAFDTGPGNMIIDHIAQLITKDRYRYDVDGRIAAKGKVDTSLLEKLMQHKFLKRRPPKSTGREEFGAAFSNRLYNTAAKAGLKPADIIATVTAFTARSIIAAYRCFLPLLPDEVILCGGGAKNKTLVKMLKEQIKPAKVLLTDDFGINADAKEAISFAILAGETIRGIPNNIPSATGAKTPVVLGKIIPGKI
ncbi:MAG: anhydro-N-acetylmuramic acid kinase [Planctomycetota bacterium]|nr:anhydro-N-acetylmuramic acid kinase [Planctomycetota bacterium]